MPTTNFGLLSINSSTTCSLWCKLSETLAMPPHFGVGGRHGRKGGYQSKVPKTGRWGCTCVCALFMGGCKDSASGPESASRQARA